MFTDENTHFILSIRPIRASSVIIRGKFLYLLGVSVTTGSIISSMEMPPCWKLSRY